MRTTRKPSAPMSETVSAINMSMPWITLITAINVVVARITPNSVKKLRSLLPRRESSAKLADSQKDAFFRVAGVAKKRVSLSKDG